MTVPLCASHYSAKTRKSQPPAPVSLEDTRNAPLEADRRLRNAGRRSDRPPCKRPPCQRPPVNAYGMPPVRRPHMPSRSNGTDWGTPASAASAASAACPSPQGNPRPVLSLDWAGRGAPRPKSSPIGGRTARKREAGQGKGLEAGRGCRRGQARRGSPFQRQIQPPLTKRGRVAPSPFSPVVRATSRTKCFRSSMSSTSPGTELRNGGQDSSLSDRLSPHRSPPFRQ